MELTKKMLRDMWKSKFQFLTILFIAMLGVLAFSGLDSVREGLIDSRDKYYKEVNLADIWVYVQGVTEDDIKAVEDIDNVSGVQERLSYTVKEHNTELNLIVSDTNKISKPYLMDGEAYDVNSDGIWLDDEFAKANDYEAGDTINVLGQDLEIKGLILSAEEIYDPPLGNSVTDFEVYGYAYMSKDTFESLTGMYQSSELVITLDDEDKYQDTVEEIEDKLGDKYFTYISRDEQSSTNHITERVRQLTQFTYIFPALFFLLALLTMLVTMSRLIEGQRTQIGTLMSLGYSKGAIRFHYLSYGLWIGIIGGIIGVIVGQKVIPPVLIQSMRHLAIVPYWDANLTKGSFFAVAFMAVCCIIAVMLSCGNKLKVMPALVLHGSAQKIGRHTIFEHMGGLWNLLSFNLKSTIRNISRNKVRSFMGIIGVLGSMVLLLAGFGMKDSLDYTVDYTYDDLYQYTTKVEINDPTLTAENVGNDKKSQYIQEGNIELKAGDTKYTMMYVVVGDGDFIQFKEPDSDEIDIDDTDGFLITSEFVDSIGLDTGDAIEWRFVGGDWIDSNVGGRIVSSLPKVIFISQTQWEDMDQVFAPTAILTNQAKKSIDDSNESITQIKTITSQADSMQTVFDSTASIIYVLLFAAILLVVVVISSIGLLNYTEMAREYATLKVIGLYPKEIRRLSFQENLILTLIGWIVGIPIARWFVGVYMKMLSNDTIVCLSSIGWKSYLYASLIVLVCSLGVNLLLSGKVNKVDMVMSLKSNE